MNTEFAYFYRDAGKCKRFAIEVLRGEPSIEQFGQFPWEKVYFIPSEVGLPDLQGETLTVLDHVFHEIDFIELTCKPPTIDIDAGELLQRFRIAAGHGWNVSEVSMRLGIT